MRHAFAAQRVQCGVQGNGIRGGVTHIRPARTARDAERAERGSLVAAMGPYLAEKLHRRAFTIGAGNSGNDRRLTG